MRFMQIESVLQTKNRSEPAKNRFSVALAKIFHYTVFVMGFIKVTEQHSEISFKASAAARIIEHILSEIKYYTIIVHT